MLGVTPSPSAVPHWSLVLASSSGLLPKGPRRDKTQAVEKSPSGPKSHAMTLSWREVVLPLCLDPLGMPSIISPVPFCL